MNTNKITIMITLVIVLLLITIPTIYKVIKKHEANLYEVVEERIIGSAEKCYYEEKCTNDKIYLKELYALGYLEEVSDPISKEYYNENSYIKRKNNIFLFVAIE